MICMGAVIQGTFFLLSMQINLSRTVGEVFVLTDLKLQFTFLTFSLHTSLHLSNSVSLHVIGNDLCVGGHSGDTSFLKQKLLVQRMQFNA